MQKFCFTPDKRLPRYCYSFFLIWALHPISNRIQYWLYYPFNRPFFLSFFLLALPIIGNCESDVPQGLYVQQISLNDTCFFLRTQIDSLYAISEDLAFPPVQEIEFEFGHTSDSLQTGLEYYLAGFEENWNKTPHPIIRYTNLAKRKYELRVRIPGEEKEKRIVFTPGALNKSDIREEWWFQPLLTLCVLFLPFTLIYFMALNRSRRNLRLEIVRNQIASDLHDAVGANLGAINNLTDLLKKRHDRQAPEARGKVIEKIKEFTLDTISNLQDTVWAINPLNDSVAELLVKMKEFALLMLQTKGIGVQYENNYNDEYPIQLDMQQRHAMFMMFKEVINNIVKHANASQVRIQIDNEISKLLIRVSDNGVGFDTSVIHRGNGLKNFQQRAEDNFIDLELKSEPGQGAQISMLIHSLD